ncbi:serine/threonine-protein kinase PknD [Rubritalea halochordaticola]|uniref:Serine/threonine-protein kinase PknD n=1 Tax=Rubritalea halochordaticola TaxID=714537 RepID=A0ABP9UZM1_9BACT
MSEENTRDEKAAARNMLAWALTERLDTPTSDGEIDLEGYEIKEVLGRGAMGVVYKAEHVELGRVVALKVFSPQKEGNELFVERLKREGRLMAQLEHPNVLGIYNAGLMEDETPYLVLEYVEGGDLQKRLRKERRLGKKEAIRIAVRVCNALSAVHSLGIVHRDIKPANVLLGEDGSVKVSDFGISKEMQEAVSHGGLTLTGTTVGTVDYMSPEQSNGGDVDVRSDIYSVGVLLYEMISGVTPRGAFESLEKYGAPKDLDRLVMRCLQRDRRKRPASAQNLALHLRRIYRQMKKRSSRSAVPYLWGGLGAVAAVAVMVMFAARGVRKGDDVSAGNQPSEGTTEAMPLVRKNSWVSLTDMVDIERDAELGKWWRSGEDLICHQHPGARLFFHANTGTKYEVETEFTRVSGDGAMVLFLPTSVGTLAFTLDGHGEHWTGLEMLNGKLIPQMRSGQRRKLRIQNGSLYKVKAVVEVDTVSILINDEGIGQWEIQGKVASVSSQWGGGSPGKIGVGADRSQALFGNVRVLRH